MDNIPAPVFTGFFLALGVCLGMLAWQLVAWTLNHVKVVFLAVAARLGIIRPVAFRNGRGEIVTPNREGGKR